MRRATGNLVDPSASKKAEADRLVDAEEEGVVEAGAAKAGAAEVGAAEAGAAEAGAAEAGAAKVGAAKVGAVKARAPRSRKLTLTKTDAAAEAAVEAEAVAAEADAAAEAENPMFARQLRTRRSTGPFHFIPHSSSMETPQKRRVTTVGTPRILEEIPQKSSPLARVVGRTPSKKASRKSNRKERGDAMDVDVVEAEPAAAEVEPTPSKRVKRAIVRDSVENQVVPPDRVGAPRMKMSKEAAGMKSAGPVRPLSRAAGMKSAAGATTPSPDLGQSEAAGDGFGFPKDIDRLDVRNRSRPDADVELKRFGSIEKLLQEGSDISHQIRIKLLDVGANMGGEKHGAGRGSRRIALDDEESNAQIARVQTEGWKVSKFIEKAPEVIEDELDVVNDASIVVDEVRTVSKHIRFPDEEEDDDEEDDDDKPGRGSEIEKQPEGAGKNAELEILRERLTTQMDQLKTCEELLSKRERAVAAITTGFNLLKGEINFKSMKIDDNRDYLRAISRLNANIQAVSTCRRAVSELKSQIRSLMETDVDSHGSYDGSSYEWCDEYENRVQCAYFSNILDQLSDVVKTIYVHVGKLTHTSRKKFEERRVTCKFLFNSIRPFVRGAVVRLGHPCLQYTTGIEYDSEHIIGRIQFWDSSDFFNFYDEYMDEALEDANEVKQENEPVVMELKTLLERITIPVEKSGKDAIPQEDTNAGEKPRAAVSAGVSSGQNAERPPKITNYFMVLSVRLMLKVCIEFGGLSYNGSKCNFDCRLAHMLINVVLTQLKDVIVNEEDNKHGVFGWHDVNICSVEDVNLDTFKKFWVTGYRGNKNWRNVKNYASTVAQMLHNFLDTGFPGANHLDEEIVVCFSMSYEEGLVDEDFEEDQDPVNKYNKSVDLLTLMMVLATKRYTGLIRTPLIFPLKQKRNGFFYSGSTDGYNDDRGCGIFEYGFSRFNAMFVKLSKESNNQADIIAGGLKKALTQFTETESHADTEWFELGVKKIAVQPKLHIGPLSVEGIDQAKSAEREEEAEGGAAAAAVSAGNKRWVDLSKALGASAATERKETARKETARKKAQNNAQAAQAAQAAQREKETQKEKAATVLVKAAALEKAAEAAPGKPAAAAPKKAAVAAAAAAPGKPAAAAPEKPAAEAPEKPPAAAAAAAAPGKPAAAAPEKPAAAAPEKPPPPAAAAAPDKPAAAAAAPDKPAAAAAAPEKPAAAAAAPEKPAAAAAAHDKPGEKQQAPLKSTADYRAMIGTGVFKRRTGVRSTLQGTMFTSNVEDSEEFHSTVAYLKTRKYGEEISEIATYYVKGKLIGKCGERGDYNWIRLIVWVAAPRSGTSHIILDARVVEGDNDEDKEFLNYLEKGSFGGYLKVGSYEVSKMTDPGRKIGVDFKLARPRNVYFRS